jgi:CheY-like chemotaxis protein
VPDAILCDIGMPHEDGFSFITRLRESPSQQARRVPAAALTAYTRVEDRVRALSAGYQIHLPKPIEPAEVVAAVASLVGKSGVRPR